MSAAEPFATATHVSWPQAFTPAEMDAVVACGEALMPRGAGIADPAQREQLERIRITRMAWLTPEDGNKWFYERMTNAIRVLNERFFQFELTGFSDPFQYTVYDHGEGGHYDWHVDQGATRVPRKLSFTLQLSEPTDYEGCDLELRGGYKAETAPRGRGTLIAFPSYVLHRVTPVRSGSTPVVGSLGFGPQISMKSAFIAWKNVFTPAELDTIEHLGDAMVQEKAVVAVRSENDDKVRITNVAWMPQGPKTAGLYRRITQLVQRLNTDVYHFDITGLEALQYTVYHGAEGGHYDWHIDLGPANPSPRKISISIQLSDPSQYEGCDLQFQVGPATGLAPRDRGAVIAFPSFFLHRVSPIISGTRKSLVVWATGPEFR